jgi:mono/diheme cytochrome c family protein
LRFTKEASSMRFVTRTVWGACAATALTVSLLTFGVAAQQPAAQQHKEGAHTHADAAKMKNPVAANAGSLAAGKKLYDAQCASCHGPTGKGDGKAGAMLKPLPSDLSDGEWKHGSSDGEIFTVIRDGARQTGMRAYGSRIPANDIWNLVNYVRSLNPKTAKSH